VTFVAVRSKQLQWAARVVSAEEFHTAKLQALEVQREKKKFHAQRLTLKRVCVRNAAAFSGVIHSTSVVYDHAEEEDMHLREMEEEISRLQNEADDLRGELELAQQEADEVDNQRANAEESRDQISGSWRFTANQLENAQSELRSLRKEVAEAATYKKESKVELEKLRNEMEQLRMELKTSKQQSDAMRNNLAVASERLRVSEEAENSTSSECMKALEDADAKILVLEQLLEQALNDKDEIYTQCEADYNSSKQALDAEWEKAINIVKQENTTLSAKLHQLEGQLEEQRRLHDREVSRLVDECSVHKNTVSTLTAELAVFKQSDERLHRQVAELEQLIAQHAADASNTANNSDNRNGDAADGGASDVISPLSRTSSTVEDDVSTLLHQLETEKQATEAWQDECAILRVNNEKLSQELLTHKERIHALTLQLDQQTHSQSQDFSNLQDSVAHLRNELEQCHSDKAFAEMNAEASAQEHALAQRQLTAQLSLCQSELTRLEFEHTQLTSKYEKLAHEHSEMTQLKEQANGRLFSLEQLVEATKKEHVENQSSQQAVDEQHIAQVAQLTDQIVQLKLSADEISKTHAVQSEQQQADFDSKQRTALEQSHSQQALNSELRCQLEGCQAQLVELQQQLKQRQEEETAQRERLVAEVAQTIQSQFDEKLASERQQLQSQLSEEQERMRAAVSTTQSIDSGRTTGRQLSQLETPLDLHTQPPSGPSTPVRAGLAASHLFDRMTPQQNMAAGASNYSHGSGTSAEIIRLTALLRAKEDQLTLTMRLYDEQSAQLADVAAEASELRGRVESLAAFEGQQEQLSKLQAAVGEISASIAFWTT
jgi:chromosome segregation ATPase